MSKYRMRKHRMRTRREQNAAWQELVKSCDNPTAAECAAIGETCFICGCWFDDFLNGAETPMHPRVCVDCEEAP